MPSEPRRVVAFLRGINVGGHRVKMERLREVFIALDFTGVETFIASGNILFDDPGEEPAAVERRIEAGLREALGYDVDTFLRSAEEVAAIAASRPFPDAEMEREGHTVHVSFLREAASNDTAEAMRGFETERDAFAFAGREMYWLCRGRMTDSLVPWPRVEKTVALPASTMRNMTTVRRIAERFR